MDWDPIRLADLMALELGRRNGVRVIPTSRYLAATDGGEVNSLGNAAEIGRLLGADAVLILAVTFYDPYEPPRMAISAQLVESRIDSTPELSNQVRTREIGNEGAVPVNIRAQAQYAFDASRKNVVSEIKVFAKLRHAEKGQMAWRRILRSQQDFMEYCCYSVANMVLGDEVGLAAEQSHRVAGRHGT